VIWKKVIVIVGAMISCVAAIPLAALIANWFYMRFIFEGDISDFAPGDTFGVLFWTLMFMPPFLLIIFLASREVLHRLRPQR
jgi:hypothetical protein